MGAQTIRTHRFLTAAAAGLLLNSAVASKRYTDVTCALYQVCVPKSNLAVANEQCQQLARQDPVDFFSAKVALKFGRGQAGFLLPTAKLLAGQGPKLDSSCIQPQYLISYACETGLASWMCIGVAGQLHYPSNE